MKERKVIVLAIQPKYAKAIYEDRKNWEFRKVPPPLYREMFVYESAPVSAITGIIVFSAAIKGTPLDVIEMIVKNKCFTRNLCGISLKALEEYTGKSRTVTGLRVRCFERFDKPIPINFKPPQNWGTYYLRKADDKEGGHDGNE